jgi:hypothetical protein
MLQHHMRAVIPLYVAAVPFDFAIVWKVAFLICCCIESLLPLDWPHYLTCECTYTYVALHVGVHNIQSLYFIRDLLCEYLFFVLKLRHLFFDTSNLDPLYWYLHVLLINTSILNGELTLEEATDLS